MMRSAFIFVLIASLVGVAGIGIHDKAHAETVDSFKSNPPVMLQPVPQGVNLDESNTVLLPGTINDVADNIERKYKEVVGENLLIGVVFNQDPNRTDVQTDPPLAIHKIFYGDTADPAFAFMDRETNRAHVPIRFIAERLGANVEWQADTQTIVFTKDGLNVQVVVGQKQLMVNNVTKTIDAPAFVRGNRTYVPVRFISEAFGAQVFWKPRSTGYVDDLDVVLVNYQ